MIKTLDPISTSVSKLRAASKTKENKVYEIFSRALGPPIFKILPKMFLSTLNVNTLSFIMIISRITILIVLKIKDTTVEIAAPFIPNSGNIQIPYINK